MKSLDQLKETKEANQHLIGCTAVSKKGRKQLKIKSVLIQPCNVAQYELGSDREDNYAQGEENDIYVFLVLSSVNSGRLQLDQFYNEYDVIS